MIMAIDEQMLSSHPHADGPDPRATDPADRLLEDSWKGRQRRASRREMVTEVLAGGLFLGVALPLALPALLNHRIDLSWALLLVALYAVVAGGVRFPIGAGYLVPTYVILVPMLLLLPPATVPLLAAVAWVLAQPGSPGGPPGPAGARALFAVPNAWHALGPAAVLMLLAGTHHSSG